MLTSPRVNQGKVEVRALMIWMVMETCPHNFKRQFVVFCHAKHIVQSCKLMIDVLRKLNGCLRNFGKVFRRTPLVREFLLTFVGRNSEVKIKNEEMLAVREATLSFVGSNRVSMRTAHPWTFRASAVRSRD